MTAENPSSIIHDVLIVGAGPCGLAVAARLREKHPSALFTDEEQARYNWIAQHAQKAAIKNKRTGKTRPPSSATSTSPKTTATSITAEDSDVRDSSNETSIVVLDGSGSKWMSKWNRLFNVLSISHLRSPMFFHPDPHDRDSLLAYAYANDRSDELEEITGCVGKEISKHKRKKDRCKHNKSKPIVTIDERDRKDYFTPSTGMFRDFCQSCISRYRLDETHHVHQETVLDITYDYISDSISSPSSRPSPSSSSSSSTPPPSSSTSTDGSSSEARPAESPIHLPSDKKLFTVKTEHATYFARIVVLAVGAGRPIIPAPFSPGISEGACHAMAIRKIDGQILHPSVKKKMVAGRATSVLVIGGGLTSAQVADAVIKSGVSKVVLLMRSAWKIKPFDVDLSWIAKFKNHQQASFWSADTDEERMEYVKEARNGGSITPRYTKKLKQHIDSGRLVVHCQTSVHTQSYHSETQAWKIETCPPLPDLPEFDYIYFATGAAMDFTQLDFLQKMHAEYPIATCGGLPVLTDDLMWSEDVPLFMTGRLATLRIGPGAGNLEGARAGAERIAWAIDDLLNEEATGAGVTPVQDRRDSAHEKYVSGVGSRFASLADVET